MTLTARLPHTAVWDTSGWEVNFAPTARYRVRCWRWTLSNRRDRTAKRISGLALTERAAHRRAWRAWQKETCS